MNRLKNKIAIITGGAGGIGQATALTFAHEGAQVMLWDVNLPVGETFAQECQKKGLAVYYQHVDISHFDAVEKAAAEVIKKYQRIDILINNAGITRDASLKKMTPQQWQEVITVNLTAAFNCGKVISAYMCTQQAGCIINTSSVVALYGNYGQSNYVAAKAGLIGLTKVWAKELGSKGITVNAVAPGFIATEMVKTIPSKIIAAVKQKIPLARLGQAQDIANAYVFLASNEASYINGAVLSIDGGISG